MLLFPYHVPYEMGPSRRAKPLICTYEYMRNWCERKIIEFLKCLVLHFANSIFSTRENKL